MDGERPSSKANTVAQQGDDLGERKPAEQQYNNHDPTTCRGTERSKDSRTARWKNRVRVDSIKWRRRYEYNEHHEHGARRATETWATGSGAARFWFAQNARGEKNWEFWGCLLPRGWTWRRGEGRGNVEVRPEEQILREKMEGRSCSGSTTKRVVSMTKRASPTINHGEKKRRSESAT